MENLRSSQRQQGFLQLARDCALLRQEEVLGELLRQRRAALRHAAVHDIGDGGARDAVRVDSVMIVEAPVFDRDEGPWQVGRHVLQRQHFAGHVAAAGEFPAG